MTIEEARAALAAHPEGLGVIYRPRPHRPWAGPPEEGTITSVNDRFVFVRYGRQRTSAATNPADLELLASAPVAGKE
jgi:hypothetical protein